MQDVCGVIQGDCLGIEIGSLPCSASTVEFADSATHWEANIYCVQLANAGSKILSLILTLVQGSLLPPLPPSPHLHFPPLPM